MRAVLRAGAYELGHRRDVPARAVVAEYVDVAGAFVERQETGMVNAVLDQLARQLRAGERRHRIDHLGRQLRAAEFEGVKG